MDDNQRCLITVRKKIPKKILFCQIFFRQINGFKVICMDSNQNGVNVKVEIALQRGPTLCVEMDFTRTFEANAKCNNINHV